MTSWISDSSTSNASASNVRAFSIVRPWWLKKPAQWPGRNPPLSHCGSKADNIHESTDRVTDHKGILGVSHPPPEVDVALVWRRPLRVGTRNEKRGKLFRVGPLQLLS